MTRAISHDSVKDDGHSFHGFLSVEERGNISQHLRNHVHLTNCIHLKNHMHRQSPILADRSLMRDLIVLQRSRSLRDPSTSPPSWLSPSIIATLVKRSGKDAGFHSGRRSVGLDRVDKLGHTASVDFVMTVTSGGRNSCKGGGDDKMCREVVRRVTHGEKASNAGVLRQNSRSKTLSEQLEEIPSQTISETVKPSRLCEHRGQQVADKTSKEAKTNAYSHGSGLSRAKRRKFRVLRRNQGSLDSRGGRVHNEKSAASTSLAHVLTYHNCSLEEGVEEQRNSEMDITQAPRNRCGIPWNWSRIHHRGKTFLDIAGRSLSCGLSDSRLRKAKVPTLYCQQDNSKVLVASEPLTSSTGSDSEALPLLLEPSGSPESNLNPCLAWDCSGDLGIYVNNSTSQELDSDLSATASGNQNNCRDYRHGRHRSLAQKYMPKTFKDLVGQSLVVQALSNAALRRKIGLIYVFYGPHGTGKTSCARVFAKALNCLSAEHPKPCDLCTPCISHNLGKNRNLFEVGPVSTFDNGLIMNALENGMLSPSKSYKVFIIDDCDALTPDSWITISKVVNHAPRNVVFILVSSCLDHLPHVIISRCQKFYFPKLKESDIILTLQWISASEGLEIDKDAMKLIASRSDGSLRDAEMTLEQLSLLGQRISLPLVQELVGLVSDEKLVDLLDVALSADTVNTVKILRDIIETGVEPLELLSQLATLITDILAGSCMFSRDRPRKKFFCRQHLSREDMEKLCQALRTISEAEKQLRQSNDKLTWLTAALLQIIPDQQHILPTFVNENSLIQSPLLVNTFSGQDKVGNAINEGDEMFNYESGLKSNIRLGSHTDQLANNAAQGNVKVSSGDIKRKDHIEQISNGKYQTEHTPEARRRSTGGIKENSRYKLGRNCKDYEKLWQEVIGHIQSHALKKFLSLNGRLSSVSLGSAPIVQVTFASPVSKSKAEKFRGQILQAFECVLNATVILEIRCELQNDVRQDAQVPLCVHEPGSSRMNTIQQSVSNQRCHSLQSESHLSSLPKESDIKGNGFIHDGRLLSDTPAIGREHKGKGLECTWGEASSSQQNIGIAPTSERRTNDQQCRGQSLVRGKVSLAHVIQQAEGGVHPGGWSREKAISIAEKLEQENLRLEPRLRSLLCWKSRTTTGPKLLQLRSRKRKPRSLLKLVTCSRCLSSRSPRI
ncbi:hypothetical protein HPP92_022694 [Vanilla planifolia]|uniref:AAA+ ATPase domain-containing protein n=1 Tax=Vanilla planifolia TaxID=51239 RepID=A0A835UHG8_VANPL|nr:hypothetical protein HPP92_022694 [Vanilla planifolia]